MPRKSGTKEKFVSLNVELSTKRELEKHRFPGEPLYQTAHRMLHKYLETEMQDTEFMMRQYEKGQESWKNKYMELLQQRSMLQTIERFV